MPSLSHFTATRQARWAELERLLATSEGNGLRNFSAEQIEAVGQAYRQVVSDLAIAQRDFPDDQLTLWLNGLATRAHLRLYRAPAPSWRRLGRFFSTDFARRFRAAWRYLLVAAVLLFAPAVVAYVGALLDPTLRDALVPAQMRQVMQNGRTWTDIQPAMRPGMATLIFTNNIQVAFLAFAGGVLFGLGTVYVLLTNGLMLGGVLGAAQYYGVAPLLWAFVSPHGYLELTCICITGAAGLMMGDALLRPGLLLRREAVARAARRAVELVAGAAPVLVVAGLIEGFVSPSELPTWSKFVIGPLVGALLYALLLSVGRRSGANT
ncbi:MAG TPA: stage II sporulation protein M [Chloroflexota bacterium]|nr:stage II sporulation protein M [Chloroflexota bacterium]